MARFDYDLVTIGAGSGGVRASRLAGGWGVRTAVIEKSRVGGTCVMRGCVPKKLLVYGSHYAQDLNDARGFGWHIGESRLDWGELIRRKDAELDRLERVYRGILQRNNVRLIEGEARLLDPHTVEVDGQRLTADRILIACGGRPELPAVSGIERAITSDEALELPELPQRIVIVGGGYIAVEFAGIFNAAGAAVTQVIRAAEILRGFDADVRTFLAAQMESNGIRILRGAVVEAIRPKNGGSDVLLADGRILQADLVLYATGRTPNTRGIGLEAAGVAVSDKGAILVDEWSRSSVGNIYAVGDCTDRINLTPVAIAEGHAFADTCFNNRPRTVDYDNIPSAVFSQPPVGTVGLSEADAAARGPIDVYVSRFRPMKHTLSSRHEETLIKLVVDAESDRVLGCHMVGLDAPEIVQGLAVALKCRATKAQFDATIGIHPTAAEEFVTLRDKRPPPDSGLS
ncbi:MAG: glutathione-disulfide reductase [Rhodospirillales bacterium]